METKKRWAYLLVGAVMMVLLGLIYAWSIFVAPLEAEFGWTRDQTSLTFTICMTFFVIGLITNGFLAKHISARKILLISAVILLAGFGLCSRIGTIGGLYIFYGVLVGFAVGICNNALVSTLVKWFPDKIGTASGILMMGFGLGGMVLGSLATGLIDVIGWRSTFLWFGIGFAVIIALGSFVVKLPPADYAVAGGGKKKRRDGADNPERGSGEMLRRPTFWLYLIWFTFVMAGGLLVISHAAPFVSGLGATATMVPLLAGMLSLCNGVGRILTGVVYDRVGLRTSMLLTTLYLVVSAGFLLLANVTGSLVWVVFGFLFAGFSYGGGPTTCSTFSSEFYGMKHFAMNYAIVSAGLIPGALLGPYLAGKLYESSGGYFTSFIAMLAFSLVALVFSRLIRKP